MRLVARRHVLAVVILVSLASYPFASVHTQGRGGGGQAQAQAPEPGDTDEQRKAIREVADNLKGRNTVAHRAAVPKDWKPERTPWGDPDVAGNYSNSDESGIPLERPAEFDGRRQQDITPAELAKIRAARREQTIEQATRLSQQPNPQLFWWETLNATNSRAWLLVDPPDGKVPPLTAEAQRRQQARAEERKRSGRGPADSWIDRSLYDRCISRGLPGSMMPAIYGSSYDISQGPGFVAIRYEMIHEARVIPLDGRPRVSPAISSYMGDARGRWEGTTLVIDTRGFKDIIAYRGSEGGSLRVGERFTPRDPNTLEWQVTIDDPNTWTKPWTYAMNLTKKDETQPPFEYACHEGNYGLRNILSAARADDRAAATK
jgi:hypothetical protein